MPRPGKSVQRRGIKKLLSISPLICSIAFLLIPLCDSMAGIFGYDFILYSKEVTLALLTGVVCLATVGLLKLKISLNKFNTIFATILLPISILNALFFVTSANRVITTFIFVSCGCAIVIFGNYSNILALNILSGVIALPLLLWLLFLSFFTYTFGGISSLTVVKTLHSPQSTYIAEIIDSDQGALGGNTFVEVKKIKGKINVFMGEFSKLPIRVYTGEWGEFENMDIWWQDEHRIIINGIEHVIE